MTNAKSKDDMNDFRQIVGEDIAGLVKKNSGLENCFDHSPVDSMFSSTILLKQENSRSVFVGQFHNGVKVFCKMYREKGLMAYCRQALLGSRAQQAHARTAIFSTTQACTPASLGYMVRRKGYLEYDSYHFCEYLSDAMALSEYFEMSTSKTNYQTELLTQLAIQLASVHANGFVHGDTKLSNFLYTSSRLYFVDLDGFQAASKRKSYARDIARLIVALLEVGVSEDKINTFVTEYCGHIGENRSKLINQLDPLIMMFQNKHKSKYGRTAVPVRLI